MKYRFWALVVVIICVLLGSLVYASQDREIKFGPFGFKKFTLGLDLSGGTELTYVADVSDINSDEVEGAMSALRVLVEKRVNLFGVSEPIVQVENSKVFGGENAHRLVVELPGITNVEEAVALIGKTPVLEFKLVNPEANESSSLEESFLDTGLTGRFLKRARLEFAGANQSVGISGEPYISLEFNDEGSKLFAEITKNNIGGVLAIFLDGEPISLPVVREEITGGQAQITGVFTATEARDLVRNLNLGALPVPIELANTQTIGPTLGEETMKAGVKAGLIGFLLVILFMIFWYRLPGLAAAIALSFYIIIILTIFKLIPVTLTSAGIAGFILSVGMAVDANVLIFERLKEELRKGRGLHDSIKEGVSKAWSSIRDSNLSSLITAVVLFYLGTSAVQGFALTFGIGVLVSMFSAIIITRLFLLATSSANQKKGLWLYLSGIDK